MNLLWPYDLVDQLTHVSFRWHPNVDRVAFLVAFEDVQRLVASGAHLAVST
jgi:hypothetical protein